MREIMLKFCNGKERHGGMLKAWLFGRKTAIGKNQALFKNRLWWRLNGTLLLYGN